jgi:phosphate transport system substrate-binding protein
MDCITLVVNPKNPVNELSFSELAKIFTGEAKSWKDFGGPDKPINVLSRESSSGTYVFFQEHVLNKKDYSKDAKLLPATNPIIEEVSTNEYAIGYVGLGYAMKAGAKVKVLAIKKEDNGQAVMPSEATVHDGTYPVARKLYIYAAKEPTGIAKDFIDFCLSPEGQKIAQTQDEIPVK